MRRYLLNYIILYLNDYRENLLNIWFFKYFQMFIVLILNAITNIGWHATGFYITSLYNFLYISYNTTTITKLYILIELR